MRSTPLVLVACLAWTMSANAAKPIYECNAPSPVTLAYPSRTFWNVNATVPAKANLAAIVTGAGAPGNERTFFTGTKHGSTQTVDRAPITTLFTTAGTVNVQLVDVQPDGSNTPIATCTFDVV